MKKKPTLFVLLALFTFSNMVMCQHQDQTVTEGCMSLTIPSAYKYKIEKKSGSIGSSILLTSNNSMYIILEMNSDFDAEYVMHNSILNNVALSEAKWGDVEDCTFLTFDAKKADFTMSLEGETRYGSTVAFNGGNEKSYGIIVWKTTKHNILEDQIVSTLKLMKNDVSSNEKYETTRKEVEAFIDELKPNFGSPIALGVTMENIELDPKKDVITFTFGVLLITKSDFDDMTDTDRNEFVEEMRKGAVEAVKNMKTFSAMKRCMDDGYTFIINYHDANGKQMISFSLKSEDYK